jgi:hypothetical protein
MQYHNFAVYNYSENYLDRTSLGPTFVFSLYMLF